MKRLFDPIRYRFDVPCTVEVSHTFDSLHAHVILPDGVDMNPGDQVLVHGEDVAVPYGEVQTFHRTATVGRATLLERLWTRATGDMEYMELLEFSFSEEVYA
ncbi:MAG: hypothetical protein AAGF44_05865 [Pseudomonadota bacterium]